MTPDDIQQGIEELARSGDGADRRWALKLLATQSQESESFGKPEDLSEWDVVERMAPLMLAMGKGLTERCYAEAFRMTHVRTRAKLATIKADEYLTPENVRIDHATLPKTLKQMYKKFPESRRPGFPPGYPAGRSEAAKTEWVRKECVKMLVERAKKEAADADHQAQEEVQDDLPEGSHQMGPHG